MILHFASTGQEFGYSEYLAILTASKVHLVDEIWLWTTEEPIRNPFFEEAKKITKWHPTEVPPLPGLDKISPDRQASYKADYIRWAALENYGGLYLDLDTISIRDVTSLMDDREVCVAPESLYAPNWMGAHCVIAKPHSEVIKYTYDKMMYYLNTYRENIRWGYTAPKALADAYEKFGDTKIKLLPYIITSPFLETHMMEIYNENVVVPKEARIIHLWHSVYADRLRNITPEWIAQSSCPLAVAVKRVLGDSVREVTFDHTRKFIPEHTVWKHDFQFGIRLGTSDEWTIDEVFDAYTVGNFVIPNNEIVVDIGAHIGTFSIFASRFASVVYAYEPEPDSFRYMKKNIELNGIKNIICENSAVSDKEGLCDFWYSTKEETVGHSTSPENRPAAEYEGKVISVEATTLSKIISKLKKIGFLKIDCEGCEYPVLFSTSSDDLQKIDRIAMECHHYGKTPELMNYLDASGFNVWRHWGDAHLSVEFAERRKLDEQERNK